MHRIRGRVPAGHAPPGTTGQALGKRDNDYRYYAPGARGRPVLRLVWEVGPRSLLETGGSAMGRKLALVVTGFCVVLAGTRAPLVAHHAFSAEFDASKPVD